MSKVGATVTVCVTNRASSVHRVRLGIAVAEGSAPRFMCGVGWCGTDEHVIQSGVIDM
jgi:hypothetical protein